MLTNPVFMAYFVYFSPFYLVIIFLLRINIKVLFPAIWH